MLKAKNINGSLPGFPHLVHEGVRFIDQGTRSPFFCLAVDRVGPDAGVDKVQSRA
jgi:hypothetical protein